MNLYISAKVRKKLREKHNINEDEITQCFSSREKGYLEDTREDHKSDPPTLWFVSETDYGRSLKVVFILKEAVDEDGAKTKVVNIRTAYEANADEIRIYQKYA